MVSTRRSGSLSGNTNNNNSKRSSSSEDKPPSPKRQKVFFFFEEMKFNAQDFRFFVFVICTVSFWSRACFLDGKLCGIFRLRMVENSKELCEPSMADPSQNALIVREDAVSTQKDEVAPTTAVDAPIANGEFFFFSSSSLFRSITLTVLKALSFLCLCVLIRSKLYNYQNSKLKVLSFFIQKGQSFS